MKEKRDFIISMQGGMAALEPSSAPGFSPHLLLFPLDFFPAWGPFPRLWWELGFRAGSWGFVGCPQREAGTIFGFLWSDPSGSVTLPGDKWGHLPVSPSIPSPLFPNLGMAGWGRDQIW